jgi:hypothetical protein
MRNTILFAAAVAALALTAIRTWFGVGIFTATGALAGSVDKGPAVTGAKRPPTSLYDDYEIVVH